MKPSERIDHIYENQMLFGNDDNLAPIWGRLKAVVQYLDEQAELLETHTVKEPCNEQGPHYCKFGGYSLHVQAPSHTVKEGWYETRT